MSALVRIENNDGIVSGTKIFDVETSREIHGVQHISVDFDLQQGMVAASLQMCLIASDIRAVPTFYVIHPRTGEHIRIKSFTTDEGEVIEL